MQGRFFHNKRDVAGLKRAVQLFSAAIAKDSGYARAWAGLGEAYRLLARQRGMPVAEGFSKARAAGDRAVALDPQLADGYEVRGHIRMDEGDWAGAKQDYLRALAIDSVHVNALSDYAQGLDWHGRSAEAIPKGRRAVELDPLSAQARNY